MHRPIATHIHMQDLRCRMRHQVSSGSASLRRVNTGVWTKIMRDGVRLAPGTPMAPHIPNRIQEIVVAIPHTSRERQPYGS